MSVLLEAIENFDTIQQGSKKPPRRLTDIPHEVHACYRELSYVCVVQAAEKYLKALLCELGLRIPRIHNLAEILVLLLPFHAVLAPLKRILVTLSRYAVDYRYPGLSTSTRQMRAALRHAERVGAEARTILGLPT